MFAETILLLIVIPSPAEYDELSPEEEAIN